MLIEASTGVSPSRGRQAAADVVDGIVEHLKKNKSYMLPGFGTFSVRKTKARIGMNPATREKIKVKAGKTVRFKPSPALKKAV